MGKRVKLGIAILLVFSTFLMAAQTTITYAVRNWDVETAKQEIAEFNKVYPNIKVEMITFDANLNEFLTARVAAGQPLPDVMTGWEGFTFLVTQGWLYPFDEFVANDPDWKYVPATIKDAFKYNGKTYAIPWDLHFHSLVVNLDLLEQLNIQKPSYNWTIDQFKSLLRRATTREYSGINHLWEFDAVMAGVMDPKSAIYGFDPSLGKFRLQNSAWASAIALQKELKSIPGLVSDDLKNNQLREQGLLDDYQKKFGKDADAFREGKILMGFHGTWDWSWLKTVPWKFDFYPLPQDPKVGFRQSVHANYVIMSSTTKYPKEAFAFAKFISFSPTGITARLKIRENFKNANGEPEPSFIIPGTMHPTVIAKFNSMKVVPEGVKYLLRNLDKTFTGDLYKVVPGWDDAIWGVIYPAAEQIRGGTDPRTIVADVENKANQVISQANKDFSAKLSQVEKDFIQTRKKIEGK